MSGRRGELGSRAMREVSRGLVESWLTQRAEWMINKSKVREYLAPKIEFADRAAGKVSKGLEILAVGAGKGHEMDEMDQILPGSHIVGVDPHDHWTRPVVERSKKLAHDMEYLPADVSAENLKGVEDQSLDAMTFFFVLHHVESDKYDEVFAEMRRVLKDDGYVFIAEDLVQTEEERKVTERVDRVLNAEISEAPHNYMSEEQWREFVDQQGFRVVDFTEEKPDKVRHGFFVLEKKPIEEEEN